MMRFPAVLDPLAQSVGGVALTPRGVAMIWGGLLVFFCVMRAFVFPGAERDDSEMLVHTQQWAWGYDGRNPPLFTWLVKSLQLVAGPTLGSVVFVKFALLGGAYWMLFLGARRALADDRLAALVALSPLAMYHVVWVTTFHLTHTAALAFTVTLTFYAVIRLEDRNRPIDYLFLGVACGLGLLSKYNYALFASVFLAAACTDRGLRRCILDPWILLAAVLAVAAAAPHYVWLRQWVEADPVGFSTLVEERFALKYVTLGYNSAVRGLIDAPLAVLHFLLPCLVFLGLLFPRAFWVAGSGAAPSARYRHILGLTLFGLVFLIVLAVGVLQVPRVKIHYMFILILFPIFFFARVQATGPSARSLNLYAVILVIMAGIVGSVVVAKYFVDPQRRSKAQHNVPYKALADGLRAAGFERGTIVGDWFTYSVAGNLRPYFPESRIVNLHDWRHRLKAQPTGLPWIDRPTQGGGQCLLVWTKGKTDRETVVRHGARLLFGMEQDDSHRVGVVSAFMPPGGSRPVHLAYILAPLGAGTCR
jgi:4-amino-4-deoxy-L-arabinose transferase-like glycosyltransferase